MDDNEEEMEEEEDEAEVILNDCSGYLEANINFM